MTQTERRERAVSEAGDRGHEHRRRRSGRRSWRKRKHVTPITVLVALVVLGAGLGITVATWDAGRPSISELAASAGTQTAPAPSTPPVTGGSSAPSVATSAAAVDTTVRGTITAVSGERWTLADAAGLSYTVVLTPATKYARKTTASSYRVGSAAAVTGSLSAGVITAASVTPGR